MFVFLLQISVDNRQIHSLRKIHNQRYFLISCSSAVPPHYFLVPMFPSLTRPFMSVPRNILSCFDILSINLRIQVFPKIIFLLHAVVNLWSIRAYCFSIDPFTSSFMAISLSDTLTPSHLQDTCGELLPHHCPYPICSSISSIIQ